MDPTLNHVTNNNKKAKLIFKEEFLRFCENTTIRGVPRIIKSKRSSFRYLWFIFFILLLTGCVACFIFLCNQYLEYNVIHPPRILSNKMAPFPSFTVCNLRPLSRKIDEIFREKNLKTPREFARSVNNYAIHHFFKKNKSMLYERASSAMLMGGYLESVPNNTFTELGHIREEFIIHCQATYMVGSKPQSNECNNLGLWQKTVHPQYINCYSFNLFENLTEKTNTIELYLYLDEKVNKTMCIDCFSNDVKTQLSGALILIHRRNTYPNFDRDMINVQPGTLTEIKLKIFKNINKLPPYGRCSKDTPSSLKAYNDSYEYSEHLCKLTTIQNDLNTYCNCNAIEYPFNNFSLKFCSSLPNFILKTNCNKNFKDQKCLIELENAVEKLSCKTNVTMDYNQDIVPSCKLPCSFYSYESDRSTSTWPAKSWQVQWIESRSAQSLKSKPELQIYRKAFKLQKQGRHDEVLEILNKVNILEEKLLAIMMNRPNYNLHVVEEKEVLSLTSFLSQTGGLFSIWIGLTLISIVEIVEMFISCFCRLRNHSNDDGKRDNIRNQENLSRASKISIETERKLMEEKFIIFKPFMEDIV